MTKPALDDRSRDVLKSLIQVHIMTGEPVGSETLARAMNRAHSSATIRNIMADLERLGYLVHPHTSAGRMPTDDGYRVFVDSLMRHRPLAAREAAEIESQLRLREASAAQLMELASHLLSRLSGSVGFVLAPDLGRTELRHLDLVRLPHPRVLVVLVSRTGLVTHKVVDVEEELGQDELQACANYVNAHFAGLSLREIRSRLLELMGQEKALYDSLLQRVLAVGRRAFAVEEDEAGSVYLDGTSKILDKPEFVDVSRMRALFKAFEEKSRLVGILNACLAGDGVRILIGHEIPDPELTDLAVVSASYAVEGEFGWGLGVLGATRMEYPRVVPMVDHVARTVSLALAELRA